MVPSRSRNESSTQAAVEAWRRGWRPLPIRSEQKSPHISSWPRLKIDTEQEVVERFDAWSGEGARNIGLILGQPSGGLVDVDIDHFSASRLKSHFLPPTAMRSGRSGRPASHFWYVCDTALPGTRNYRMPDKSVSVELRSTGGQTLVPPSIHPSGEAYRWEGEPWGGKEGPARVDGRALAVQVALLAMGAVLIDEWPKKGGRHDAYLALAGGLLRFGRGVHPWWERNIGILIGALADATHDEDGPEARVREAVATTVSRLRADGRAVGFPRLSEIIGPNHAELVRRMASEVESLAGFDGKPTRDHQEEDEEDEAPIASDLPPEERDPLGERLGTWEPVDLEPYLFGEVKRPQPTVLVRDDGHGLFYSGRVNSLYGQSEAAKSWIALIACQQEMEKGERVMYLDFEDEPSFTIERLQRLGSGDDDIRHQFTYVRPEDPLEDMQKNRFGQASPTSVGRLNRELFTSALERIDPTLIIVDGMTVLYGLHALDSNDAVSTDIITSWLKRLCRNGRSTVIVIDHTGKSPGRGSPPIGAHHKIAMVQGTALQAHPVTQPMPGVRGEVDLIIFKDRPGSVRAVSVRTTPSVAATVVLDSTDENATVVSIKAPDPDDVEVDLSASSDAHDRADREERKRRSRRQQALLDAAIIGAFGGDIDLRLSRAEIEAHVRASFPDDEEVPVQRTVEERIRALWSSTDPALIKTGSTRDARYGLLV